MPRKKHKERRRSRSRSRSSKSKHRTPSVERTTTSRTREHKEKKRDRKSREKVLKRISEERPTRDYDAEEKIGTEDDASSRRSPSGDPKADDMDISNSP